VDGAYRTQQVYRAGEAIRPAAFPDVEIVVAEFLGPA
jgi:hypothetical protein